MPYGSPMPLHRDAIEESEASRLEDADELGGVVNGSAGFDEGGEDVHLPLRRRPRKLTAQVPGPHAHRSAAAIHSPRPSIGIS